MDFQRQIHAARRGQGEVAASQGDLRHLDGNRYPSIQTALRKPNRLGTG